MGRTDHRTAQGIALVLVSYTTACSAVLGNPFDGYQERTDAQKSSDAGDDSGRGTASGALMEPERPQPMDECRPAFVAANGVKYPLQTDGALELHGIIDTTPGSPMGDACSGIDQEHCVIAANSIHIVKGGSVWTGGTRPLVLIAANDIVIDDVLNVAGDDGNGFAGPGEHTLGTPDSPGGGGGNADNGAGNGCGTNGGDRIDREAGLIGGGHGTAKADADRCAGGRGGGALQLTSLCGQVRIGSYIDASGGGGMNGSADCPQGYGGGAGGTVWIQSTLLLFGKDDIYIQLTGGGGGGGSCTNGDKITDGIRGMRRVAGDGADCGNNLKGGHGGDGAMSKMPAQAGGDPSAGEPGAGHAECGGGGGSRGRVILDGVGQTCSRVLPYISGECLTAK